MNCIVVTCLHQHILPMLDMLWMNHMSPKICQHENIKTCWKIFLFAMHKILASMHSCIFLNTHQIIHWSKSPHLNGYFQGWQPLKQWQWCHWPHCLWLIDAWWNGMFLQLCFLHSLSHFCLYYTFHCRFFGENLFDVVLVVLVRLGIFCFVMGWSQF